MMSQQQQTNCLEFDQSQKIPSRSFKPDLWLTILVASFHFASSNMFHFHTFLFHVKLDIDKVMTTN